jgi:subtilisin family serine protease
MFKRSMAAAIACLAVLAMAPVASAQGKGGSTPDKQVRVNVVLNTDPAGVLEDLGAFGHIHDVLEEIDAVSMQAASSDIKTIARLPYVDSVTPDAERYGSPIDTVPAEDFTDGITTWNLDAIDVSEPGFDNRTVAETGAGVYVAVLDSGLVDLWRQYFPEERIASEYARSFGGGGGEQGDVSEQPNQWEHDTNSHGTHVTSTILGYSLDGVPVGGVAPQATVIPVKVLQSGSQGFGWSSVIARGILYVAGLKEGPLANSPVVINMSLGGPSLDAVEKAAVDYAIAAGVIVVAAAGNAGEAGMGFPAAYAPVISVAAAGWGGEWEGPFDSAGRNIWWFAADVPEGDDMTDFYITDFSSRKTVEEHDLDVAAPGSWIVGPYNVNRGQTSYFFLGGTSMACPHVAGVVALMAEANGALTASEAELALEETARPLFHEQLVITGPSGASELVEWDFLTAPGAGLVDAPAAIAAGSGSSTGGGNGKGKGKNK